MAIAHINIGSNIGDRRALIETAVARIESALGVELCRSAYVESLPWGYVSPNPYLNLGLKAEVGDIDPLELFHKLQSVERSISTASHRDAAGGYTDRLIDVDLIALGDMVVDTPELTLPHPRMHQRVFVLGPMNELEPDWRHPVYGRTPAELISDLDPGSDGVECL